MTEARTLPVASVVALAVATAVAAVGCQTVTTRSTPMAPPPVTTVTDVRSPAPARTDVGGPPVSADEAVGGDASAARLHDIEGALLMYQALHHRLPQRLEELKPLADADADLDVTYPPTGQPYLYVPGGLEALGTDRRILVADPIPSAKGTRACILEPPPSASAGAAASMEVVSVPEAAFKRYVPAE